MTEWMKASRSYGGGACVEVAPVDGGVAVRDSKQNGTPNQAVLVYTVAEFETFLLGAKNGEFDHLVRVCHRAGTRDAEETT